MKVKDYEYKRERGQNNLSEERKAELIAELKDTIRKDSIPHYKILEIGQNDAEFDFIYKWLIKEDISIRGINGTISGEIPNFEHLPKDGQDYLPDFMPVDKQMELFNRMQELRKKHKISKECRYEDAQEKLEDDIKEYDKIRHQLIEGNMRLVKFIAQKYTRELDVPREDRQQMGMIGLIKAVDRFDPNYGAKFSTYASVSIYNTIIREWMLSKGMNVNVAPRVRELEQVEEKIYNRLGREATDNEIIEVLGINRKTLIELKKHRDFFKQTLSIEERNESYKSKRILTDALNDDERIHGAGNDVYYQEGVYVDVPIEEPISDIGVPEREATYNIMKEDLDRVLKTLTPKEAKIMTDHVGMEMTQRSVRKRNEYNCK